MENLPLTISRINRNTNESLEQYVDKIVQQQNSMYRNIASRLNWLLERVHIENISGTNNMVFEIIVPGQNKNTSGNWRIIITSNNCELQENVNGTWTERGKWIGT